MSVEPNVAATEPVATPAQTISAYFTNEQVEALAELTRVTGLNRSEIFREACALYAKQHGVVWPRRVRVL